jgi:hypothetical protein
MKTSLVLIAAILMLIITLPAQAQKQNEGTAIRTYLGYVTLVNTSNNLTHSGPAIMFSFPAISSKMRAFGGGGSLANGVFGGLEYSLLTTNPDDAIRTRVSGGAIYSFSKEYINGTPERHRYISLYLGGSILIDITRNMAFEATIAPALINQVSFPAALVKVEQGNFGFYTRASLKIPI